MRSHDWHPVSSFGTRWCESCGALYEPEGIYYRPGDGPHRDEPPCARVCEGMHSVGADGKPMPKPCAVCGVQVNEKGERHGQADKPTREPADS